MDTIGDARAIAAANPSLRVARELTELDSGVVAR